METRMAECPWCKRSFEPRSGQGGKAQIFCGRACRRLTRNTAVRYILIEVAAGRLDMDRVREVAGSNVRVAPRGLEASPGTSGTPGCPEASLSAS
jgi:hypothetical protein